MNQNEKNLLKELCQLQNPNFPFEQLQYASPVVLGHLFYNRMQGIAYKRLKQHSLLGKVNREFRNSLKAAYEKNIEKNQSYFQCVSFVSDILSKCNCPIAMLKGAYLCARYPQGCRTSNDIDLLVLPQDVATIGNLLNKAGFIQGNIQNDELIFATRKEIIESRMTRGETIPYIKEVNLPSMRYLEVDINFSLDYKNGDENLLSLMLSNIETSEKNGIRIPTLAKEDFFIHLSAHLYKEATTLPWIEMRRDMALYKYCDIYMLLSEMSTENISALFMRAKQLKMEKVCGYAILETSDLFDLTNHQALQQARLSLADDPTFTLRVRSPKDKKTLIYQTSNATERFFMEDRTKNLKEVINDENT